MVNRGRKEQGGGMTEDFRIEHDSMGEVKVPSNRYWGAQTQRSIQNFPIGRGRDLMPGEIISAFALESQS